MARTKLPTTAEAYDRGARRERARLVKILRGYRDAHDEVLESAAWRALDEVIQRIDSSRPLIEVVATDD